MAAGILNRILGFIPRVTLPRIIGAEGVGIYQLGYPFLLVIITLITGGVPLAVAKLIAEADSVGDRARVRRILSVAMKLTVSAGIVFSAAYLMLAPWMTSLVLTDTRVYYTLLVMTPIIIMVAISAVLRGYFQGMQNMVPTAVSQVTETFIRSVAVIGFAYLFLPYGLEWAAAGAMGGVVVGELGGLIVLIFLMRSARKQKENGAADGAPASLHLPEHGGAHKIASRLLGIALPVTGGKLIGSLSYLLESIAIARSLAAAGVLTAIATAQYGALQGMIIPILTLPGALTYSLAVSLVPSLSEALGRNDIRMIHKRIYQAIRLALVCGAPFAVIMFVLALPLCVLLYNDPSVAPMLRWMAPIAVFIYLQAPLQAALQALERPGTALVNTFIGAALKLLLIIQLASQPQLGIYGAIIAICMNVVVVTLLHTVSVIRHLHLQIPWLDLIKVGSAMLIMAGCIQALYMRALLPEGYSGLLRFIAAGTAGVIVYLLLLIMMGIIDRDDVTRLPRLRQWLPTKPHRK
ncbi:membrane protein [Paenibacillus popilliae ATCC 14706]|uniref:Membrane protein n=1 Tax=Paenibacillus popilliae ATCC 14706 TaxID=1212764 RepID=M9M1G1_PAEPP|nr:membrane protein [Paenibacillus popilliae ATCC 14706]